MRLAVNKQKLDVFLTQLSCTWLYACVLCLRHGLRGLLSRSMGKKKNYISITKAADFNKQVELQMPKSVLNSEYLF